MGDSWEDEDEGGWEADADAADVAPGPEPEPEPEPKPEPEPEPEPAVRVRKKKKDLKAMLAEKDAAFAAAAGQGVKGQENMGAYVKVVAPPLVKKVVAPPPTPAPEQEPVGPAENWEEGEEEVGKSALVDEKKRMFTKAELLATRGADSDKDEALDALIKLEAVFGPMRAHAHLHYHRTPPEPVEAPASASRADNDARWQRGASMQQGRQDQGGGGNQGGGDKWERGATQQGGSWRQQEVQLTKTDNAWKPGQRTETDEEACVRKINGILNKLTVEKFDSLVEKFLVSPPTI